MLVLLDPKQKWLSDLLMATPRRHVPDTQSREGCAEVCGKEAVPLSSGKHLCSSGMVGGLLTINELIAIALHLSELAGESQCRGSLDCSIYHDYSSITR